MQTTTAYVKRKRFRKVRNRNKFPAFSADKLKTLVKYLVLTACGISLFLAFYISERSGRGSPGGEMLFISIPLIYYFTECNIVDTISIIKNFKAGGNEND